MTIKVGGRSPHERQREKMSVKKLKKTGDERWLKKGKSAPLGGKRKRIKKVKMIKGQMKKTQA